MTIRFVEMHTVNEPKHQYPELRKLASEYVKAELGYSEEINKSEVFAKVMQVFKSRNLSLRTGQAVWNRYIAQAFKFWDVSTADLMACSH